VVLVELGEELPLLALLGLLEGDRPLVLPLELLDHDLGCRLLLLVVQQLLVVRVQILLLQVVVILEAF
jgi:hypothetical protein